MTNKIGNGVKGKYMDNMDYTFKNIDKLEELKGYEWEYKNAEFILESTRDGILSLRQKNAIYTDSKRGVVALKAISLCNLTELEFYGLKSSSE